jgi:hypothetical protein
MPLPRFSLAYIAADCHLPPLRRRAMHYYYAIAAILR